MLIAASAAVAQFSRPVYIQHPVTGQAQHVFVLLETEAEALVDAGEPVYQRLVRDVPMPPWMAAVVDALGLALVAAQITIPRYQLYRQATRGPQRFGFGGSGGGDDGPTPFTPPPPGPEFSANGVIDPAYRQAISDALANG